MKDILDGIDTFFNEMHPSKTLADIIFKEEGNDTSINDVHLAKTLFLIESIWEGLSKITCCNEEQSLNALSHIKVTEEGIDIFVKEEQNENALQ